MRIQIMHFLKTEYRCSPHACVDLCPPSMSVWETGMHSCPEVCWHRHESVNLKEHLNLNPIVTLGSSWFCSAVADLWCISIKAHFFLQLRGGFCYYLQIGKIPLDILISKPLPRFPTIKRSWGQLPVNAFIPVLQTSRYCDHEYWIEYEEDKSLTLALNSHTSQLRYVWHDS